jgi:hypothetical protein
MLSDTTGFNLHKSASSKTQYHFCQPCMSSDHPHTCSALASHWFWLTDDHFRLLDMFCALGRFKNTRNKRLHRVKTMQHESICAVNNHLSIRACRFLFHVPLADLAVSGLDQTDIEHQSEWLPLSTTLFDSLIPSRPHKRGKEANSRIGLIRGTHNSRVKVGSPKRPSPIRDNSDSMTCNH